MSTFRPIRKNSLSGAAMNKLASRWTPWLTAGAMLLTAALPAAAAVVQVQKALPSDFTVDQALNVPDERLGESVAMHQNWMAVGAPNAQARSGSVSIYERVGGLWEFRRRLTPPTEQAGSGFGTDVDIHEAGGLVTVIVGAPQWDAAQVNQGRAFVYSDTDAAPAGFNFSVATINPPSPELDGRFGASVALFGDVAAIAAPNNGVTNDGFVAIRMRNTGGANAWGNVANKAGNLGNAFGTSVDVHGEYLIVGAPYASNGSGVRTGLAYVYRQDQGGANAFGIQYTLSPSTADPGMAFGHGVSIWDSNTASASSASRSAVGAPLTDNGGFADVGSVTFFNDNTVNLTRLHIASANNVNAHLGYSLALESDNAIAGRPSQTVSSQALTGQVDTFFYNGTVWATNTINLTQTGAIGGYRYGRSVALSGLVAVVGAPGTAVSAFFGIGSGIARRAGLLETLDKPGVTWAKDTDSTVVALADLPTLSADQQFSDDMAMSADWLAVGVEGDDNANGVDAGAVYLYRNNAGTWTPHSKLTALYGRAGDHFGQGVAIEGNRLFVGAPTFDGFPSSTSNAGATYVFEFNGSAWAQTLERMAPTPSADAFFGNRMDLMGDVLAVSATGENANTGAVYAYRDLAQMTGGIPLPIPGLTAGAGAGFGVSVYDPAPGTANDESIAVGALFLNATVGAAWVFSGATFASVVPLANPTPATRFFGSSVAIFNGRVAVGAPTASPAPSGAVHVFTGVGYANVQTLSPTGSPGQFGYAVELDDTRLLIGAPATNGRAGTAYVFSRSGSSFSESAIALPGDLVAQDEYGATLGMANGIYAVGAPLHDAAGNAVGAAYLFEEAPEVTVTPTTLAVSEAGPTTDNFTVSLSQAPSSNVTIQLTYGSDVQVNAGSGFGASPQTVTLTPANAISGVTVSVQAVDDAIDEVDPESVTITSAATSSAQSRFNGLDVADVTVNVGDNDTAGVSITQSGGSTAVSESGTTDTYTIVLDSQPSANVNVAISFPATDLTLNGDTDGTYNTTFTTANWNTAQTITVAAVDDRALEGNHSGALVHAFTSSDAVYQGITARIDGNSGNSLTASISDNETGLLEWVPASGSAGEGANNATSVRLDITAIPAGGTPTLEGTIGANIGLTLGTAEAADLGAVTPSVTFTNSSDLATAPVTAAHNSDTLVEGNESYSLALSITSAPLGTSVSPTAFAGTITDAQSATVALTGTATVSESVVSTPLTVTLTAGAGNTLEGAASVVVNLTDGTATYAGGTGDYFFNGPNNTVTVNFAAGSANGATQNVPVNIREDVLVEASETFTAGLGATTGAISAAGPGATLTINDNEAAAVSFQAPTSTVGEATTPHNVNALLTITAVGSGTAALSAPLTVAVTQTPDTAATPADYTLSSTSVTFAAASQSAATQPIAIAIVDDTITESNETFTLGFGAVTGTGTASGTHTVTITDNDTPGITVTESGGNTSVVEGGANDSYSVVLNSQPTANVTINVNFDPAQLVLNGDTDGSLSLQFTPASWNTPLPVSVAAVNDTVVETNPHATSITQTASSTDPFYGVIDPADVAVSIGENDTQEITFALASSSVSETAGNHIVNARLNLVANGSPGGTIAAGMSANVFLVLGSAEAADLSLNTAQVTFAAGSAHNATQPINLSLINDRLLEGDETGTLNFSLVGTLGTVSGTHALTLTDDETGAITFTTPSGSTSESAGTYTGAIGRLTLSGTGTGPLAAEASVSVAINDTAGSATTPADYTRTTTSLVFAANAPSPVDQAVAVTIANDVLIENVESFTLGFGAVTGAGALGASGTHGVSISDNDLAQVAFAPANDTVGEGSGSFSKPVVLALTADGVGTPSLQNALVVPVGFTEGSATEPEDFTLATTSLSFAAGSLNGASLNATANLIDDAISEPTESFDLTLGNGFVTANITLGRAATTVSITDNDTPGVTVTQSGGNTAVTEGGATDTFTVVLTSQPTANVTIALTGSQVTPTPTPLTFTSGNWNVAQTVTVTAIDDAIDETSPHAGSVSFGVTSGDANYNNFAVPAVSVQVSDNDTAGVTVTESGGNTAVTEGGATDSYTVVLQSEPTGNVTVVLSTTAQLSLAPPGLTFTPANWNVAQTVTVTATDDGVVEGPHNATINQSVTSSDPNYSQSLPAISVAITDNDSAVVNFAPAAVSQAEGTSPMAFTVTLSNPVASGVTLTLNSANGTATAADYTPISGATVSFPASSAASQTVNVVIANDALDEDDETFTLTLSGLTATGNVTLGTAAATGTILDDDATPTLSITSPSQNEGNAGTSVMNFTVSLGAVSGRNVSFTRATADGTATVANNDYVAIAAGSLSIPAGQTSLTIPVTINGDTVFEGNETFSVNLTGITNATPGTLTGTGTLIEDDQQPTTTTITSDLPDPSVVGQPYTVNVTVAAVTTSPTGTVTISDGTASCGPVTLTATTAPNSTASCSLTSTTAGAKTLTASYTAATTAFGNSSGTTSHQVNPASTAISVTGPTRSRINQPTAFTFALSVNAPGAGTPTGTVTLSSGASSCTATLPATSCNLTFTTLGTRTVSASYAGDANFSGSSSSGAGNAQTLVYALADLSVTKNDGVPTYEPGDLLVYSVIVRNLGPDAAANIRITDAIPAGLTDVTWSCDDSGGVACPVTGGSGNLDLTIASFPVGGLLNLTFYGNVNGSPASISNTASITLPADTTIEDPVLGNNTATDTDLLDGLFANGFEDPQINGPTGSLRIPAIALARSLADEAVIVVRLSDANGEAIRVYARMHEETLQYALVRRNANGLLRPGAWTTLPGEPTLSWTARQVAAGWVLETVELR